jgi:hypothetical protein|tara:strand:- start:415 stop:585 length:171 start_codon:yes stop_codon:yes gene_type:complete
MRFEVLQFNTVSECKDFVARFFPNAEKVEGGAYQVTEQAMFIVDNKKILFMMSEGD